MREEGGLKNLFLSPRFWIGVEKSMALLPIVSSVIDNVLLFFVLSLRGLLRVG